MMFDSEIAQSLREAVASGAPFALWGMPGCDNVDIEVHATHHDGICGKRFVYSPWLSNKKYQIGQTETPAVGCIPEPEPSISRDDYIFRVGRVVDALGRDGGKAVVSRAISGACDLSADDIIEIASDYFEANPGAFRCLFSAEDGSIWLTATPELLLSYDTRERLAETMALAGTQPVTDFPLWDIKNIEEHGFVVDYIMNVFTGVGLKPERRVSQTLESAGIFHLCTPISCECRLDDWGLENLLSTLNPTPAVCGFPKDKALSLIAGAEVHRRGLYAGYVGVESDCEKKYFVNLRTCRFTRHDYTVYVGGGITSKSVPAEEWDETCLKAACMLEILKKHGQTVSDTKYR